MTRRNDQGPANALDCLRDEDVFLLLQGGEGEGCERLRAHLDACEACQELVACASSPDAVIIRDGDVILDRFRVVGELGRGGMGVVYRVHDPKLHRDLAIKILHSADPAAPLRLEREAQALARLSHPNIVTVFDIGGVRDQVCMVMELVDGASLRAWLVGRPARDDILRVLRQAGAGLHAAHRAGLVHRDFKPENVLVGNDGRVKIVDFGLAAADLLPEGTEGFTGASLSTGMHRLTRTGRAIGTPAYMAPEQFEGIEADARSDQFAFAVCAWEALRGEHPFHATTVSELRRNIARGPGGRVTRGEDVVTDALLRALSVHRDARFASMEDLLHAIDPASRARPRPVASHVVTAIVVAIIGASATFFAVTRGSQEAPRPASAVAEVSARATTPSSSTAHDELPWPTSSARTTSPIALDAGGRRATSAGSTAASAALRRPASEPTARPASPETMSSAPLRGPNGAPLIE